MSIAVPYATEPYADEASVTLALGSGSDRAIIALTYQSRSPPNIDGTVPLLNGVSATGVAVEVASLTSRAMHIAYWLDADAPSSAGSYTFSFPGTAGGVTAAILECTGIHQTDPIRQTYTIDTDYPTGYTLPGATISFAQLQGPAGVQTGDLMTGVFYQAVGVSPIAGAGVTTVVNPTINTHCRMYGIDAGGHTLDLDPVKTGENSYFCLAAFKPSGAAGITVFERLLRGNAMLAFSSARKRF